MKLVNVELHDVFQTGEEMRRLACDYCADLGPWLDVPFIDFYRHVCRLPYIPDPPGREFVSRPAYTLNPDYIPRDCDDKAVLCAAWLHAHKIPCRFIATSTRPDGELHHVFLLAGTGEVVDATYRRHENTPGKYGFLAKVTNAVLLTGWF